MKLRNALYMTFFVVLVDCMSACVSDKLLTEASPTVAYVANNSDEPHVKKSKKSFHQKVETKIPILVSDQSLELIADIYRPQKKTTPKTLVIIAPGSGNVSRRGEVTGDGVKSFKEPLFISQEWGRALSDQGFFVLSYDKRTCTARANPICLTNDQRDIDEIGLKALASDLDQAYAYAIGKLGDDGDAVRVVILSTTQGAQVLTLSESSKKASGIILLSPILGDLESMWVFGLDQAAKHTTSTFEKNQLLNRKESMAAFFGSLKRGNFKENASVRGATVKFWLSWMDASINTLPRLVNNPRPTLLLFSKHDEFTPRNVLTSIDTKKARHIKVKTYADSDRNFISENGVPAAALKDIVTFINELPGLRIENS